MFFLFRRSIGENSSSTGVWALLLGSVIAITQFFLGDLINPGGFGLDRWIYSCVDIIALPAVLPIIIYLPFLIFRLTHGKADVASFALLWLIPGAGVRAVSWSSGKDPVLLILVPILWTALAVGIPFFIDLIMSVGNWFIKILSVLCILALPFLAATAWWAFYSQRLNLGIIFLGLSLIPLIVSMLISFLRAGD